MLRLGRTIVHHFNLASMALAASAAAISPALAQHSPYVPGKPAQSGSVGIKMLERDDGTVIVRGRVAGGDEGGIASGPGATGRCCLADGTCSIITLAQCNAASGVYMGDGTTCAEYDCAQPGRCCINNDFVVTCEFVNIATCFNVFGGDYWQPGVTCAQSPCAPFGACCRTDGGGGTYCQITAEFLCDAFDGVWMGDNVDCSDVDCEAGILTGMCCIDEECFMLTFDHCQKQFGTYYGDGVECDDFYFCGDDPEAGACCLPNGSCTYTTESLCDDQKGTFFGIGELCEDHNCGGSGGPGACCFNSGTQCDIFPEAECDALGGTYAGQGTNCTPGGGGTCPDMLGQCCLQAANGSSFCMTTNLDDCFSMPNAAYWSIPSTCETPSATCELLGACCMPNGTCQVSTESTCTNFYMGVFKGNGTTCVDSDLNGQAEVCEAPGDTNNDGIVDVADLLNVITSWGTCPAPCSGDLVAPFGVVDVSDLLYVIVNWS